MKVLVIGNGGREHALAWKLAASDGVTEVLVAPGNAGTAREAGCRNVPVGASDIAGLLRLVGAEGVGFTVVGPEAPLAAGLVDAFRAGGHAVFGPTRAAAQLESSKAFAKDFLKRHGIPTAGYEVFTDADQASAYIATRGAPIVVKADGLAAGKGVVVAMSVPEAVEAARDMLSGNRLGAAGARVVIEDFLAGEEASYIVVADGTRYWPLATAQDHKRIGEGDTGPNTGGMGAYSPAPVVTPSVDARVREEIIEPTLKGMLADGVPFTGFLYAGLMIAPDGSPRVIEFNARLGDPETQPILTRLDSDLLAFLRAAVDNRLPEPAPVWSPDAALGVVLAAGGYPGAVTGGEAILGLDNNALGLPGTKIFHAGTVEKEGQVMTAGGRVLCVTGRGASLALAQKAAYARVAGVAFDGMQFRRDIGWRALVDEGA